MAPLSGTYRRHEPEKTVLHGVVRDHLETFLSQAGETDVAIRLARLIQECLEMFLNHSVQDRLLPL